MAKHGFPQGTLEMMIMKVISSGSHHGWGIAQKIHLLSDEALKVEEGSLYPTLSRMQRQGLIEGKMAPSENNRQAKFYKLTPLGKLQLEEESKKWESMADAIARVMSSSPESQF